MTRTQADIADRFREAAQPGEDLLGFRREVLAEAMTRATLIEVVPNVEESPDLASWEPTGTEPAARAYLDFAIEKIEGHRGISASRSVDKLREYAWLLGRDDVVAAMDAAGYAQYGAPKVRAFAHGMGWPWPDTGPLQEMAEGRPCDAECIEGCGR